MTDKPNPRGEILLSGPNIASGYYKNPTATAEAFTEIQGKRYFCSGLQVLFTTSAYFPNSRDSFVFANNFRLGEITETSYAT